jgi:hypothetical protein
VVTSPDPWTVRRRLDGLIRQLEGITKRDPEQEVQGIALQVLDAVIVDARALVSGDDQIAASIADLISPESVERGDPIRAVDALLVVQTLRDSIRMPPIHVDFGPHGPSPNRPPGT